jgi:Tol biopolymer transport system component
MKKIFLIAMFMQILAVEQALSQNKTTAKNSLETSLPKTAPGAGSSLLHGKISAPAGSSIELQNGDKNNLIIKIPNETGKVYSTQDFHFTSPLMDGAKYKVTLKKIPMGQTGIIYSGAEGTMPQTAGNIIAGCDYTYELVSRSSDDKAFSSFYESYDPAVGGDPGDEGRYITFVSTAAGIAGSSGKHRQIFWRDRNAGITKLISAAQDGSEGNADSYAPAISGDGKSVAFESYSSNLVEKDENALRDVFLWNANTHTVERISLGTDGREVKDESYEPSISGDGNLVAFTSTSGNFTAIDKGTSTNNVFLRDVQSKKTIMISIESGSKKGGGGSKPSISYDGKRIAFYSHSDLLVSSDRNGLWDIFLWDKDSANLRRISLTADGKERNQGSESANRIVAPAISGNGRFIAYATTADNMVAGDQQAFQDVFVYDIRSGNTVIASANGEGKSGNADSPVEQGEKIAVSFDGEWVAFSTNASNLGVPAANIVMHNMKTGVNHAISTVVGSSVGKPSISHSGGYVVFGIGGKLDGRFSASGIFANFTAKGPCRACSLQ